MMAMFDLDVLQLAQYGAVGIALGMISVGGFIVYKIGMALINATKDVLTNHLTHLNDTVERGFDRVTAELRELRSAPAPRVRPARPPQKVKAAAHSHDE